jgi:hypothetical protein
MNYWKPWDAAPKDGREIIVRYPKQGNVKALVRYCTHHDIWMNKGTACIGIDAQECEWTDIPGDEPCDRRKLFEAAYMAALAGYIHGGCSPQGAIQGAIEVAVKTVRQWPEFMAALEAKSWAN